MVDDRVTTTQIVVTFSHPFELPGLDAPQAPGTFDMDIDNERIDGGHSVVRRHVATYIYLPTTAGRRMVLVAPADLAAALDRDRAAERRRRDGE